MANRKFRRGTKVRVDKYAVVAERYKGRKGIITELPGKTWDGIFIYGLTIHDRKSPLEVYETEITKA